MKATVDFFKLKMVIAALDEATTHDEARSVFDFVRFTVEGAKLKIDAYDGNDGVHVTLEADDVYALQDGSAVVRLNELAPIFEQLKAFDIAHIDATGGGKEPIVIKLNPNYLRMCLENVADQRNVVMEYCGKNQPVKFCGPNATAVVVPLREI